MSPFSLEFGGSLDEDDINSLVAFIRAWEVDPPVELPPEIERAPLLGGAPEVFAEFCSQCHGPQGEGGIGPSFQDPAFHAGISDDEMFTAIDLGHPATAMIAWGQVLTDEQMAGLVTFIRRLEVAGASQRKASRFSLDVLPILEENCGVCHGSLGGWNSDSYNAVMTTGNTAPVVIPGDPDGSLIVQLLTDPGTRTMPPGGMLPEREIQTIIDWISSGAANN
jgi:mono/diheme cytochrome c family protein